MGKRGPKPKRKDIVWTPELAYAVGLITTDGCLSNDGRHLTFVSKDMEQIQNLKKCLKLTVKVGIHRSGRPDAKRTYHRLQWGDVTLYNFLLGIGLMPNKSRQLASVAIPDLYFFDFLRGHYDGDGSFYSYFDPRWKSSFMFYLAFISGSRPHVLWLQENIKRFCGVVGHVVLTGKNGHKISNVRYAKREASIVLARMYENKNAVSLSRKRLKIERALRIVGKSLPK